MKKTNTTLKIITAAFVLCASAISLLAQDDFVSRYTKAETLSDPNSSIKIKSAEVERLDYGSLLTVSMVNETNRMVRKVYLQLQVFDSAGRSKGREEWVRRADLVAGNNAELDILLKSNVKVDDRLVLKLLRAK